MNQFPIARRENLIVEKLSDEVLVYDLVSDKAHCLNRTAALIWQHCDGEKSEGDIAALIQDELKTPMSAQVVTLGLEELAGYNLLKEEASALPRQRVSRRRLVQHLGLTAAIALPVIMSIVVPAAAGAGSAADPCIANPRAVGCPCNSDADCDSANCNGGICGPELRPSRR